MLAFVLTISLLALNVEGGIISAPEYNKESAPELQIITAGDLDGLLMPLILVKSTVATLTATVRREGVQRERDTKICVALSVRVGGLSVKIAAGVSAVMSMITYAHQMGNTVSNA